MFTVIQEGLAPLTVSEMEGVISTLDVFFQEARSEGPTTPPFTRRTEAPMRVSEKT